MSRSSESLWNAVDAILDRLDPLGARAQGLGAMAARRLAARSRPVPAVLADEQRAAVMANLVAHGVLARVVSIAETPLIVFKGPEVAARYPGRARRYADLDLLVPDRGASDALQAALLARGFELVPWEDDAPSEARHQHRLEWPGSGLPLEIHHALGFPTGVTPPAPELVFESAVPSATGLDGLLAPAPTHHALLLTAHSWSDAPLRRLRDFVDVYASADGAADDDLERAARAWGLDRVWRATCARHDWLFGDARRPLSTFVWGRQLAALREPTVLEAHLERWFAPFGALPPRHAAVTAWRRLASDARPDAKETWRGPPRRVLRAVLGARTPLSRHVAEARRRERDQLGPSGGLDSAP